MAKRIGTDQIAIAKQMRQSGHSWPEIAKATRCSERGITYRAKQEGWMEKGEKPVAKPGKKQAKSNSLGIATIDEIAEKVRDMLANDIAGSAEALTNWSANTLDLRDLEKRERIAESIQKRAASLLNVGKNEENVVNIAVLSQLPEALNG